MHLPACEVLPARGAGFPVGQRLFLCHVTAARLFFRRPHLNRCRLLSTQVYRVHSEPPLSPRICFTAGPAGGRADNGLPSLARRVAAPAQAHRAPCPHHHLLHPPYVAPPRNTERACQACRPLLPCDLKRALAPAPHCRTPPAALLPLPPGLALPSLPSRPWWRRRRGCAPLGAPLHTAVPCALHPAA